jgi:hypothetical protein
MIGRFLQEVCGLQSLFVPLQILFAAALVVSMMLFALQRRKARGKSKQPPGHTADGLVPQVVQASLPKGRWGRMLNGWEPAVRYVPYVAVLFAVAAAITIVVCSMASWPELAERGGSFRAGHGGARGYDSPEEGDDAEDEDQDAGPAPERMLVMPPGPSPVVPSPQALAGTAPNAPVPDKAATDGDQTEAAKTDTAKTETDMAADPSPRREGSQKPDDGKPGGRGEIDLTTEKAPKLAPAEDEMALDEEDAADASAEPDTPAAKNEALTAALPKPATPEARDHDNPDEPAPSGSAPSALANGAMPAMIQVGDTAALWDKYPRLEGAWVLDRPDDPVVGETPRTVMKWVYSPQHKEAHYATPDGGRQSLLFQALTSAYQTDQMISTTAPEKLALWEHRGEIMAASGLSDPKDKRIKWGWYRHNRESQLLLPVAVAWRHAVENGQIKPDPRRKNVLEVVWRAGSGRIPAVGAVRYLPGGKRESAQDVHLEIVKNERL